MTHTLAVGYDTPTRFCDEVVDNELAQGLGRSRATLWQDADMGSERLEAQRTVASDPASIFPVMSEGALRATLGILDRTSARGSPG